MSSPAPVTSTQAQPAVVTLPAEIDMFNADAVEAQLRDACAPGATVIADLSATTFCDSAGARALLTAHQRAAAGNAQFWAAVPPGAVRQMLTLLALDTILLIFPSVTEALAAKDPGLPGGSGSFSRGAGPGSG
jgi:anti-sigma B factor antagonist